MEHTTAEQREFEIDDLLAASLDNEVSDSVLVHVSDAELDLLRAHHASSWRVVTGPITEAIVVVLTLGHFHIAWDVASEEEAHVARVLRSDRPLELRLRSPRRPQFTLSVPNLPLALRVQLTTAYIPVSAA